MSDKIEVIGIDHGWMMMKTASQVFRASSEVISTEPAFFDNILEYNGKYYEIGCKRTEVRANKVENENYYLLTLVAIAKELKKRGKNGGQVFIAAGLPLSRFGDEKDEFVEYLKANRNVSFKYQQEQYDVEIVNVAVFPQCYAAVVDLIPTFKQKIVIVDVGSWTVDIMPLENRKPINEKCITKEMLKDMPHREFQDLSIVYRWVVKIDEKEGVHSSPIHNSLAERFGYSEEQLFKFAVENTKRIFPPTVRNMNDIMREIFMKDGMPAEIAEMMISDIPEDRQMWVMEMSRG